MKNLKKVFTVIITSFITLLTCGACVGYGETVTPTPTPQSVFETQSEQNEENVSELIKRNELPKLTRSLDFENVAARLEYLNQGNTVGYLYLLTSNGQLIREVQVSGKVTSLNTYITPMEEIKQVEDGSRYSSYWAYPGTYETVQAPDLDGTYGENVSGIFWFTPDGVYGEWNGLYQFSAERLTFTSEPLLIELSSH